MLFLINFEPSAKFQNSIVISPCAAVVFYSLWLRLTEGILPRLADFPVPDSCFPLFRISKWRFCFTFCYVVCVTTAFPFLYSIYSLIFIDAYLAFIPYLIGLSYNFKIIYSHHLISALRDRSCFLFVFVWLFFVLVIFSLFWQLFCCFCVYVFVYSLHCFLFVCLFLFFVVILLFSFRFLLFVVIVIVCFVFVFYFVLFLQSSANIGRV